MAYQTLIDTPEITQQVKMLEQYLDEGKIPEQDAGFAKALVGHFLRFRGLTEKQAKWPKQLVDRVHGVEDKKGTFEIDVKALYDFLMQAKTHLKYPKLVMSIGGGTGYVKVYISGETSVKPNCVNILYAKSTNLTRAFTPWSAYTWMGRIDESGVWMPVYNHGKDLVKNIHKAIKQMAKQPAKVASEFGKLTGHCCFCFKTLSDPKSTEVGYGKTCANHYNLPWGK